MNLNPLAQPIVAARSTPVATSHQADGAEAATGTEQAPGTTSASATPSPERVEEAVASINRSMGALARGLEFSVDADSRRTVVKVIDQQTKELIRQIPTVEALEIAQALERAQGLLIKQTA